MATGPLSFQQAEMVARMVAHPECAPGYDETLVFQLIGPVDVQALEQALEQLSARHGVLRTTIRSRDGGYVQDRGDHCVSDVARAQTPSRGVAQPRADFAPRRMTVEQALAGARLFQPEIHEEEDERHRIVFHVHHLLYDGESFPLLWRDLSELYAASREARAPQLPELGLEYVDFAGQQRGSWIEDRRRALPFWRSLAAGATGAVEWPAPAVVAGHPYEQEVTQFELSPASARAATAIARRHRVSPFFVLLAATAGAIAAVTGCEDPLIGTDVANRGSRHKQEVGHFLSSRLTRFVEPRERPVADLVGDAREAWFAAEDFDDVYIGEVLPELGISGYIPVLLDPVEPHRGPCFDEVEVVPIDLPPWPYYWRDAWISWLVDGRTFGCQMAIRRSRVAGWVPDAVAAAIEARLGGGG